MADTRFEVAVVPVAEVDRVREQGACDDHLWL